MSLSDHGMLEPDDDMTESILAKSDQLNASDLIAGPIIVTVTHVTAGTTEQPRNLHLAEYPDKAYRPSKGMRTVLVKGWGRSSKAYAGRRLKLFRNPAVKWAGKEKGGIEIDAMSDIDGEFTIPIPLNRNEVKKHTVKLLADAPAPRDWAAETVLAGNDVDALKALWTAAKTAGAGADVLGQIQAAGNKAKESAG